MVSGKKFLKTSNVKSLNNF